MLRYRHLNRYVLCISREFISMFDSLIDNLNTDKWQEVTTKNQGNQLEMSNIWLLASENPASVWYGRCFMHYHVQACGLCMSVCIKSQTKFLFHDVRSCVRPTVVILEIYCKQVLVCSQEKVSFYTIKHHIAVLLIVLSNYIYTYQYTSIATQFINICRRRPVCTCIKTYDRFKNGLSSNVNWSSGFVIQHILVLQYTCDLTQCEMC